MYMDNLSWFTKLMHLYAILPCSSTFRSKFFFSKAEKKLDVCVFPGAVFFVQIIFEASGMHKTVRPEGYFKLALLH